jgi:hypothetical protein
MSPDEQRGALVVSAAEFDEHCRQSDVLVTKNGRPALLAHADAAGRPLMTKVWHRQGVFTSDLLVPYYQRFRRALETLSGLDVPVPRYRAHGRVAGARTRFVVYAPLPGVPLRWRYDAVNIDLLAEFVCGLHARGVYFRGLHLGNIILRPEGGLGLIDVQDIRFLGQPLGRRRRERNLGILCAHPGDLAYMLQGHWSELVMAYCRAAGWSVAGAARMRGRVEAQIERRRARRAARRIRRGLAPVPVGAHRDGSRPPDR